MIEHAWDYVGAAYAVAYITLILYGFSLYARLRSPSGRNSEPLP